MTTKPYSGTVTFTATGTTTIVVTGTATQITAAGDYVFNMNLAGTGTAPTNGIAGTDLLSVSIEKKTASAFKKHMTGCYQGITTINIAALSEPFSVTSGTPVKIKLSLLVKDGAGSIKIPWEIEKIDA